MADADDRGSGSKPAHNGDRPQHVRATAIVRAAVDAFAKVHGADIVHSSKLAVQKATRTPQLYEESDTWTASRTLAIRVATRANTTTDVSTRHKVPRV